MTHADPHAELAALAGGLEAELERARRRGVRHTAAPSAPANRSLSTSKSASGPSGIPRAQSVPQGFTSGNQASPVSTSPVAKAQSTAKASWSCAATTSRASFGPQVSGSWTMTSATVAS